jgi:hypothetical protein
VADQNNDFEQAFAEFSSPDGAAKEPANAAPAGNDGDQGAAQGAGDGDGGGGAAAGDAGGDAAGATGDGSEAAAAAAEGGDAGGDAGDAGESGSDAAGAAAAEAGGDAGKAVEGTTPAAEAGPSADDILDGLKKLVGEVKNEEKGAQGAAQPEVQTPEKPVYSEEEQAFLGEYEKEWGDVAKGEALKRRAEYQQLLGYVFEQVSEYVKPFRDMTEALAQRTHVKDVTEAVPDYSDKLRDDVESWVKTQPAYLQPAYNQVINEGTVDEVKDLVDRYRAATGQQKPAGGQGGAKQQGRTNELSEPAKQAAAALAPVESKRSGVQQPSDPSNFDDAWKQFAVPDSV